MDVSVRANGVDPEWDAFVASIPGGHHVQSSLWAEVKGSVGWESRRVVLREDGSIVAGSQLLVKRLHRGLKVAFVPRGPLTRGAAPAAAHAALDAVAHAARRERMLLLKVQPPLGQDGLAPALARWGFTASGLEAAPSMTVRVDLEPELDAIEQSMRSNARRNIRRARRLGVTIRAGRDSDLDEFHALVRATGQRQGFRPYPQHYYHAMWRAFSAHGKGVLLVAEHDGVVVATSMLVACGDTTACKMAVARVAPGGPRATELTHLAGMSWARERGCRFYDLEGIDRQVAQQWIDGDRRTGHGVAHFKLGLGGEVVKGPGAYDRCFHPLAAPIARHVLPRAESLLPAAQLLLGRGS